MIECSVATEELRPIARPRRLATAEVGEGHAIAEVRAPGVAGEQGPRVAASMSVTTNGAAALREAPSTHSAYAVTESRRARPDRFSMVSREIFTGSSRGTNWRRRRAMPWAVCSKRLYP